MGKKNSFNLDSDPSNVRVSVEASNSASRESYRMNGEGSVIYANGQTAAAAAAAETKVNGDAGIYETPIENGKTDGVKAAHSHDGSSSSPSTDMENGKKKKEKKQPMVGVFEVFRFSETKDRLLMLLGLVAACIHGAAMPVMVIVFGNMSDAFIYNAQWANIADAIALNISSWCANFTLACNELRTTQSPGFTVAAPLASAASPPDGFSCEWCVGITGANITYNIDKIIAIFEYLNQTEMAEMLKKYEDSMTMNLMNEMQKYSLYYTYIGIAVIFVAYLEIMCWHVAAYNQCERIRCQLLSAILRQDIGWFDTHEVGELNTRLVDDVDQIEKGIGDKLALLFQYMAAFVAGFVVGFVYGWELTLIMLSVSPLIVIAGGIMGKLISSMTQKELEAYAKAGAVAEEVLSAVRTVVAFGGQKKEAERYVENLTDARQVGFRKGIASGLGMGAVFFVMFGSYALAFWYGSGLVREGGYSAGSMMIVFFSVLMGAFSIGAGSPNIQDYANARGAAYSIYGIIDNKPEIDSSSTDGIKPEKLTGNIEFRDVIFRYPSRPDVPVLEGLNLKVNVGQTVALVGSSGCGKSTCVQLIQRFYDAISGQVLIDGNDVKEYNVKWLRQHIGVVSQEPVLFGTTIAENIRYGRDDASMDDIEQAARKANAHDFICQLPQKYETLVGERGAQLSGGQKQRIAIARALVRDPTILLLDEATSALDTESEGIVQSALDKARQGRTTIIVAHRLSTVQTADIIAGVVDGKVVEQGNHEELMKHGGVYFTLVTNQKQMLEEGIDEEELIDHKKHDLRRQFSDPNDAVRHRAMSITSHADKISLKVADEKLPPPAMKRIMKLNSPEWLLIVIGCIAAIINGCIQPAFAILFAEMLGVFSELDPQVMEDKCNFYSGMFAVIGVIAFFAMFIMTWMFSRSGEFLTMRLRDLTFRTFLKMEIAYFDDHSNSTGALCSRLATDASAVKGATGSRLATLIQSFGSIGFGVAIGFVYSWELTLLLLAFAPFMLLAGFVEMRIMAGTRGERNKKMEEAAKIAVEAIENIRTVATLTQEEKLHQNFCTLIHVPYETNRKKSHLVGFAYSMTQAMVFFADAAAFYFGAFLITEGRLDYESMFKVFSAILFGAMAAGQASSFAPDYGKAKIAAARLFELYDRVPSIDSSSEEGEQLKAIEGSVELKDVNFHYPTRPDVKVLNGLSVTVNPGQVVALVGSSGCGKSTVVQLIERFYDPINGEVMIDNHPIQSLHLQWMRRQIGIVSQEPVLFSCSIRDNIAYGDNFREVPMEEIIEAARKANIHSFIQELPQGYDTNVGDKGAQLSGGQKQRVAIARALVRSPKILLLDEATSALDTESEKVVQEALERAQEGRTSIVIAHRLSTIQNADCIVVIQNGRVAEVGTHSELLSHRGIYYKLNTRQQRNNNQ